VINWEVGTPFYRLGCAKCLGNGYVLGSCNTKSKCAFCNGKGYTYISQVDFEKIYPYGDRDILEDRKPGNILKEDRFYAGLPKL
jgi:DnaJ-class molecular chaperone